jgi:DNA-binding HxlR family transcriptional regulator/biotin operon repressor
MSTLQQITERAWAIPVLAALAAGAPARGPVLAARLGASRAAVMDAVEHLIGLGVIAPNPGHGHPLRPQLLVRAQDVLAWTAQVQAAVEAAGAQAIARKKWTLPILAALRQTASFAGLKRALAPITPRALSLALQELAEAGLIARAVTDANPPAVAYRLTPRAEPIAAAARAHPT